MPICVTRRGDDTIALYDWMDQLRAQAHAVGGQVLSHLGNHEWMNVIGDWRLALFALVRHHGDQQFCRYVYPSEIATFGSSPARTKMIASGRIGRTWAKNYTTASRLPLHPSLGPSNIDYPGSSFAVPPPLEHAAMSFVHGGLAPSYPNLAPFPSAINELGASLLHKLQTQRPLPKPHPPNEYPGLPSDATEAEHR
jgi:hypothetical protein